MSSPTNDQAPPRPIGSPGREPWSQHLRPGLLQGVRILAVEQYGAGPFGSQFLADLGAEVIKIESPADGGDVARGVGPHFHPKLPLSADSLFFQSLNAGKRSVALNLAHPEGRALFHRLCASAHAVTSNLRGDVPGKLGLTYEHLKDHNPALVCAHLTGYGRSGPRASWPGYDYLMQAEVGYFSLTGEPGSPPARMGLSVVDYMTGVVMALGTVAALLSSARTGIGCDVDVSLLDVAVYNLNYVGMWQLNAGVTTERQPRSAHPSLTPCQLYTTADGWIYLMCNKEKFWNNLCLHIGRPDLLERPEFADYPARLEHRDALTVELDNTLRTRKTQEWIDCLGGSVPAAPVRSVEEALNASDVTNDGRVAEVPIDGINRMRVLRNPIRCSKQGPQYRAAPSLGEDTLDVLTELGLSELEQERLRALGVL